MLTTYLFKWYPLTFLDMEEQLSQDLKISHRMSHHLLQEHPALGSPCAFISLKHSLGSSYLLGPNWSLGSCSPALEACQGHNQCM